MVYFRIVGIPNNSAVIQCEVMSKSMCGIEARNCTIDGGGFTYEYTCLHDVMIMKPEEVKKSRNILQELLGKGIR